MGYSYETRTGLLCCDRCGTAGGVRRVKCKYAWCQAIALCSGCRKTPGVLEVHRIHCDENCKPAAAEFAAREKFEKRLLDAGAFVRRSASTTENGLVKVLFRDAAENEFSLFMTTNRYDSVPLVRPATPLDYGKGMEYAGKVAERDEIPLPLARLRVSGFTARARGENIECIQA